jgi:monovalent cation:H+ antiporter, CPA1 family
MLTTQTEILLLLLVACLSALAFKRLHFPYTAGLVIVGLGVGLLERIGLPIASFEEIILSPELILFIFLPPLIFESALNLDDQLLVRNLVPILTLAVPGLAISMVVVAGLLSWLTPLPLFYAMLFGALISATDPVAVIALFKEIGVPKRLTVLVEGESILNDATAIVAFELVLFVIVSGGLEAITAGDVIFRVATVLAGGVLLGWVMGTLLGHALLLGKDEPLVQATVSVIAAYMTFIVAEHYLSLSGVIAVMTAGLVFGRRKSRRLAPKTRSFFHDFWRYIAFLANSLIFLLVGLSAAGFIGRLPASEPQGLWSMILLAIPAAILARGLVVFSLIPPLNRYLKDSPIPWPYQTVMFWGGLRGAVALALVLSLDTDFANRDLLIAMTLSVALFTIIVSGATTKRLIRGLRINRPTVMERLERAQALCLARQNAINVLDELAHKEQLQPLALDRLKAKSHAALGKAEALLHAIWGELGSSSELSRQAVWLEALRLEQRGYQQISDTGVLSEGALNKLVLSVHLKRDAVLGNQIPPPVPSHEELDTRWEEHLLPGVVEPDSPAGDMLQQVLHESPSDWVRKEQQVTRLRSRYEYEMATFEAAEQVVGQISWLGEQGIVDATIAQDCAGAYADVREAALQRLRTMSRDRPQLVVELQQSIIGQGMLNRTQDMLWGLVARGIISRASAKETEALIERDDADGI